MLLRTQKVSVALWPGRVWCSPGMSRASTSASSGMKGQSVATSTGPTRALGTLRAIRTVARCVYRHKFDCKKSGVGESAIMRERCKRAVMHAAVVNALTRSVTTTLLQRVFLFWKTTTLMKAQHRELIDEFGSAMLSTEVQTAPTPPPATVTCTATSPIREIPVHPMASSQTTPVVLKEPQPIQREIHCYCSIC
eukprot:PhM_4_TR17994/c0_g1_i1/m.23987